jgi:hypothetical protein
MRLNRLFSFTTLTLLTGLLILASSCKKDITTDAPTTSKCDYAPYSKGSKFTFTTGTAGQIATDTITGDTTVGGVGYVKTLSTGPSTSGNPSVGLGLLRCDANGIYQYLGQAQVGAAGVTNFTATVLQSLKLPASVGLAWKTDTLKYDVNTNGFVINVGVVYKMQVTALGGSKTVNGTAYANDLVTVQQKLVTKTVYPPSFGLDPVIDSSNVFKYVFDKTYGLIETTQNGSVSKALKTAVIK